MEVLNVTCETCEKGKLFIKDAIHRNYRVGCNECDNTFWASPIAYSALLIESQYNSEEDVRILNENVDWSFVTRYPSNVSFYEHTQFMEDIHEITDDNGKYHYYKLDGKFFKIVEDLKYVKNTMYIARPISIQAIGNLKARFYLNPIDTKQEQF